MTQSSIKLSIIFEEIDAKEAYTDIGALRTVIKGKRDVGVIDLSKKFIQKLQKNNIGVIPLRMTSQNTIHSIIYRDKEKALKLYQIAKSKGGYLNDKNPDEAREIGKLLGYTDKSIEEYVKKKYNKKIPIRTDTEDDYDYLAEGKNFPNLNKKLIKIVKDAKGNEVKICSVNGSFVKGSNPGLKFIEFVEGGNYYADSYPGYKKFIPEDEVWIDEVFLSKPVDFESISLHEIRERDLMKYKGWSYSKAHEYVNKMEAKNRDNSQRKKLNESYQFKETIRLLNRLKILN